MFCAFFLNRNTSKQLNAYLVFLSLDLLDMLHQMTCHQVVMDILAYLLKIYDVQPGLHLSIFRTSFYYLRDYVRMNDMRAIQSG